MGLLACACVPDSGGPNLFVADNPPTRYHYTVSISSRSNHPVVCHFGNEQQAFYAGLSFVPSMLSSSEFNSSVPRRKSE